MKVPAFFLATCALTACLLSCGSGLEVVVGPDQITIYLEFGRPTVAREFASLHPSLEVDDDGRLKVNRQRTGLNSEQNDAFEELIGEINDTLDEPRREKNSPDQVFYYRNYDYGPNAAWPDTNQSNHTGRESDYDAWVTFSDDAWSGIRSNWWDPWAHRYAGDRVVEQLRATQPVYQSSSRSAESYYASDPGWTTWIPWESRIRVETSFHILADALAGQDQQEMHFSPYWIRRGLFD
jgi:hypothetical protein